MKKMSVMSLALVVVFSVAANVKADIIRFTINAGNDDVYKSDGLLDSLSLVAEDVGDGVKFTFQSSYDLGDLNHAGGAGKIHDNQFYIWNTYDVFSGGDGVTTGGSLNGAKYPGTNIHLGNADFTAKTGGYSYSELDGLWATSFVLDYAENNFSWTNFVDSLVSPTGLMKLEEAFTIGVHLQALENGNSAKVLTFSIKSDPAASPEPASMLIFGVGAVGLGLFAKRRRQAKKEAA